MDANKENLDIEPCIPGQHDYSIFNGEFYVCKKCGNQITQADMIEGCEH